MRPNLPETADLVSFTEEILNGKLYFLCSGYVILGLLIVRTQPARDVPGTSPEGPLKDLTSGTSKKMLMI